VRVSTKKGSGKANLFQPTAILDMVVYHSEQKQLQRIKEFKWASIYQHILSDVRKNAVALFMIELLGKCLKQPEANAELFYFIEDALLHLDESNDRVMANFPLFFALHLPFFFGFRIDDNYSESCCILDLEEGSFKHTHPLHASFLDDKAAAITSQLLKVQQPMELDDIKLHHEFRRLLLQSYEIYYALHIHEFGSMRTIPVLREILT
jgi:DNA repair protein RecO (recombination protein O)